MQQQSICTIVARPPFQIDRPCTVLRLRSSKPLEHLGDVAVVKSLVGALLRAPNITNLDLTEQRIADDGAFAIADALRNNPCLLYLRLERNNISDVGVAALFDALASNGTSLHTLYLGQNAQVTAASAGAIARSLRSSTSKLQGLKLNGLPRFGSQGVLKVAQALEVNTAIVEANFQNSSVGDRGAAALGTLLRRNNGCRSSLEKIYLHQNYIGDRGALAIAEALRLGGRHCLLAIQCELMHSTDHAQQALTTVPAPYGLHATHMSMRILDLSVSVAVPAPPHSLNGNQISDRAKLEVRMAWNATARRPERLLL